MFLTHICEKVFFIFVNRFSVADGDAVSSL